ncbi:MAG: hypothetical protein OEW37_08115 [Rhodospirillaceae bacterium]|nr:hypothetical protein [Rhodospirillaceae bacterium]
MNDDDKPEKHIATLNTGQDSGENASAATNEIKPDGGLPIVGALGVLFGILAIFSWAIIFVPLALIMGVGALFTGRIGWGIGAIVLAVLGIITSPMIIMMLGLSAVLAYFGMPMPM